jgi:hypothetical protein
VAKGQLSDMSFSKSYSETERMEFDKRITLKYSPAATPWFMKNGSAS